PLTWLSHMLDVQLFGVEPGWHHLVNVLLHAVDTVLLFLLLETATGKPWRSAAVAALFAAHPLHVESVAWIAERKAVLSTAFVLRAMLSYVSCARRLLEGGPAALDSHRERTRLVRAVPGDDDLARRPRRGISPPRVGS